MKYFIIKKKQKNKLQQIQQIQQQIHKNQAQIMAARERGER
jgi:hypothetical protein